MQHAQTHGTSETRRVQERTGKDRAFWDKIIYLNKQNASIKKKEKEVRLFGSFAPAGKTASDLHISDLRLIQIEPLSQNNNAKIIYICYGDFLFYKPDIAGKQLYYRPFFCADDLHMVAYNTFTIFKVHGQEQRPSSRSRLCMTAWPCLVTKHLQTAHSLTPPQQGCREKSEKQK